MNINENIASSYPPYIEQNYSVGDLVEVGNLKCDIANSADGNKNIHSLNTYASFEKTKVGMILVLDEDESNESNNAYILLINEEIGVFPHWMLRPL